MWWDKYLGQPYTELDDCMTLAVRVAQEVLGKGVNSPLYTPGLRDQARAVHDYKGDVCRRMDKPKDGYPVLFLCRTRFYHIGVLAHINHEQYILHASQQAGCVILTRLRDMSKQGYEFEGFYEWI